jgi:hypothetical protein
VNKPTGRFIDDQGMAVLLNNSGRHALRIPPN